MKAKKARKGEKKIKDLAVPSVGKRKERGIRGGDSSIRFNEIQIKKVSDK